MNSPKLVQLFLALEDEERKQFASLLSIHYFIKDHKKTYWTLFECLCTLLRSKKCGEEKLRAMSAADIDAKAFAKNKMPIDSKKRIDRRDRIFNALSNQLIDYLLMKQAAKGGQTKNQLLLEMYKERNLDKWAVGLAHKLLKTLEAKEYKQLSDYQELFILKQYLFNYPKIDENRKKQLYLKEMSHHQIVIHILRMLDLCCHNLISNLEYQTNDIEAIKYYLQYSKKLIENFNLENHRPIEMFLRAVMLLSQPNEENYKSLKELFEEDGRYLSVKNQSKLLKYMFNSLCIIYMSNYSFYVYKQIYEILHLGFTKKIFIYDSYLNPNLLINYVVITGDYQQLIKTQRNTFIHSEPFTSNIFSIFNEYKSYLSQKDRNLIKGLIAAYGHYYSCNYEKSLELIENYMVKNTYFRESDKLHIRVLKLRIYVEDETKNSEDWCRAFLYFLKENKAYFSNNQLTSNRNLINYVNDIIAIKENIFQYKYGIDKKEVQKELLQKIESEDLLSCRNWLRVQVFNL